MLAFVHEQVGQERDGTREALEALNRQLELAHRAASRFRANLPNRDEAITELNREAGGPESEIKRYAGLFVADTLPALRWRHGNEISEQLLHEVSHRHIAALLPGGKFFRWSAQSILAIWSSSAELADISSVMARSCQAPFDCRAFVGTRTATFRISMRLALWNVPVDTTELARAFDEFSQGADAK
jgi:hypothetical protein